MRRLRRKVSYYLLYVDYAYIFSSHLLCLEKTSISNLILSFLISFLYTRKILLICGKDKSKSDYILSTNSTNVLKVLKCALFICGKDNSVFFEYIDLQLSCPIPTCAWWSNNKIVHTLDRMDYVKIASLKKSTRL